MEEIGEKEEKKQGKGQLIVLGIIGLVIVGGIVYVSTRAKKNVVVHAQASISQPATKQKLKDMAFAKYAYKIFPGDVSSDAKRALTGFAVQTKQLPDGAVQLTLVAKKQEYTTQTLLVKPEQSVYFIERSLGDDHNDEDSDGSLRDDHAIVVDKDGYLVN